MEGQGAPQVYFIGRFRDAALKYQHAQKHFATLAALINGLQRESWWKPEKVEGGPEGVVRVRIFRKPTTEWSLVLGDLVHNLRGCLDHAMCGLVEVADPSNDLKKVQFPFGRLGHPLNSNERAAIKGIGPRVFERLESVRTEFGVDLNFINAMSNQDKHRLLLPVAVRQVPMKLTIDEATDTASIDPDIAGAEEVWNRQIQDGDEIPMPDMLNLGVGVLIEGEPLPFPLRDIERVNASVGKAFMTMARTTRASLLNPSDDPACASS